MKNDEEPQLVCELAKPLRIATANQDDAFYLPAGTLLYFEKSMPEGFDRFRVYINVAGNAVTVKPIERVGMIAPLSGYFDDEGSS